MTTAGRWLVTPGSRWQARVDTVHQVVYPSRAATKASQFRVVKNALTPIISIEAGAFF
jgi:hypothetical protein